MNHTITNKPHNYDALYQKKIQEFGEISIRPFRVSEDTEILHRWVNLDYAVFWGMQGASLQQVRQEYIQLMQPEHYDVFVGTHKGKVIAVFERYNPYKDEVGKHYSVQDGDCGVHIIVAPPENPIPHFTTYVFSTIMEFVFQNRAVLRVVVEPDIRNKKMLALCQKIGFELDNKIELSNKTAQLAFLSRKNMNKSCA